MSDLRPDDTDPFRRRGPQPIRPDDLQRGPSLDVLSLIQSLLKRVEHLEEEIRTIKKKLKIPE
ncbi:MAG: hypothetical protein ACFFDP_00835 [Promethearchaeota archaeon]